MIKSRLLFYCKEVMRSVRFFRQLGRFSLWHIPNENLKKRLLPGYPVNAEELVLEVGSGSRRLYPGIVNTDSGISNIESLDVVSDAHFLPFLDNVFSVVWLEAVLEHLKYPQRAVNEIFRVLKPDGIVYVEMPFLQPEHSKDYGDYQRYTKMGLEVAFENFKIIDIGPVVGPASTLAYILRNFFSGLLSLGNKNIFIILYDYIFSYIFYPIKFLDIFLIKSSTCQHFCFGFFILAKKKI